MAAAVRGNNIKYNKQWSPRLVLDAYGTTDPLCSSVYINRRPAVSMAVLMSRLSIKLSPQLYIYIRDRVNFKFNTIPVIGSVRRNVLRIRKIGTAYPDPDVCDIWCEPACVGVGVHWSTSGLVFHIALGRRQCAGVRRGLLLMAAKQPLRGCNCGHACNGQSADLMRPTRSREKPAVLGN